MVASTLDYRHVFMFITHSPSLCSMLYRPSMYNWQITNKTQICEKWVSSDAIHLHQRAIVMRVLWSKVTFINLYFSRFQYFVNSLGVVYTLRTVVCLIVVALLYVCVCVCVRARARMRAERGWDLNFLDLQILVQTVYIAFCRVIIIAVHRRTAEM